MCSNIKLSIRNLRRRPGLCRSHTERVSDHYMYFRWDDFACEVESCTNNRNKYELLTPELGRCGSRRGSTRRYSSTPRAVISPISSRLHACGAAIINLMCRSGLGHRCWVHRMHGLASHRIASYARIDTFEACSGIARAIFHRAV